MKILKKVFSVLTVVLAVASLAMFFIPSFGKVTIAGNIIGRTGSEFAFGSNLNGAETAMSSQILFCIILTAFTVLFSALSLKYKGTRWATVGFSAVAAIYMLVKTLGSAYDFLDLRGAGYTGITSAEYAGAIPLLIAVLLLLTLASSIAYLLIANKVEVIEAGEGALTIPKRIIKWIRDYKGEIKKIVWPGPRAVVKNTTIVLVMCLLIGAFIWLLDLGLDSLLKLIY